jgi:hypothetical protein
MLLYIKNGAITDGVHQEIWWALGVMSEIHAELFSAPAVATSMRDGAHMLGSKHFLGYAADVRTRDLTPEQRQQFHDRCNAALNAQGFDLVIEGPPFNDKAPHEHCEYDPKTGESFLVLSE